MEALRNHPAVVEPFLLDKDATEKIFGEEGRTPSALGMPLENRSLKESLKRSVHICMVGKGMLDRTPFHSLVMMNSDDEVVGYDVRPEEKKELEGRDDLIWVSEDFFMDPSKMTGEVRNVLCPQEMREFEKEFGVKNAINMFISPNTDEFVRRMFGIPRDPNVFTSVISFDLQG